VTGLVGVPERSARGGRQQKAVQEIMHTQEAWQEEDGEGEPPEK
jgi:hypothetical protein